jgi:hypothetical protein
MGHRVGLTKGSGGAILRMSKPNSNGQDPRFGRPVHFRPQFYPEGNYWFGRWVGVQVRKGEIDRNEAWALLSVIDETKGWPVLRRAWVRLTRAHWGRLLGMSERRACDVRDRLLEKGLLRRRPASEAPEAVLYQDRSGHQFAVLEPGAQAVLPEIKEACIPK